MLSDEMQPADCSYDEHREKYFSGIIATVHDFAWCRDALVSSAAIDSTDANTKSAKHALQPRTTLQVAMLRYMS